ncbi:MAG: tRNA dihydrouridine(20/20a) synthase DusA [Moraxellaceae bacterium]|nr:tRNA dihydrouridine(20/20a) synthase DusA [Moraxellaceae bacterium]MDP1776453.1 tRNA dihydrouridine(20/20a) synthase DusA [Moraxellaceae bacterium]
MSAQPKNLSVAPMMDWTTRHARNFLRLCHPQARLYTEMVTTQALVFGDVPRHLRFEAAEHPIALQLGGSDIKDLVHCAKLGEDWGYDEINLNVGCPSDRVQQGRIGACLMAEPTLVGEALAAMQAAVGIPVTVKHRIGIDGLEHYDDMLNFVDTVAEFGCTHFIVHARIAILAGLSPKENRDVPPLRYQDVYRLKTERPQLHIEINGGIKTVAGISQHWQHTDGVMIGREAYQNPYLLVQAQQLWGVTELQTRGDILRAYLPFVERELTAGCPLNHMTRHILGLFQGEPGGRRFRQVLSTHAHKPGAGIEVLTAAAAEAGVTL